MKRIFLFLVSSIVAIAASKSNISNESHPNDENHHADVTLIQGFIDSGI